MRQVEKKSHWVTDVDVKLEKSLTIQLVTVFKEILVRRDIG